jgi:hypothetical protein
LRLIKKRKYTVGFFIYLLLMTTMLDPIKEQNGNHDNTDQKLSPTVVGDDPQIL